MRKFVIIGTVVILGIIGVTALALAPILMIGSIFEAKPLPSDEAMIAHFHNNRVDFELLVKMAKEDKRLERLTTDFSKPEDPSTVGVNAERLMRYRHLFKEAGIPLGFYNFRESIAFVFHASGLSVSGTGRNFVYGNAPNAADEVSGDLEAAAAGQNRIYLARKIAPDWWITLEKS
jgi:hypothetical protein